MRSGIVLRGLFTCSDIIWGRGGDVCGANWPTARQARTELNSPEITFQTVFLSDLVLRARGPKNGPKMPKITSKCNFTVSSGVLEPFGGVSNFRRFDPKVTSTLKQRPRVECTMGVRQLPQLPGHTSLSLSRVHACTPASAARARAPSLSLQLLEQ